MKRKGIVWTILGLLIIIGIFVLYLFTAIRDLVSLGNAVQIKDDLTDIREDGISVEGDFYYLTDGPVFSMKHTINGLIPIGTEYYFLLYSNDLKRCIYVRASEDFAEEFYDEVDKPNAEGRYYGAHIKGRVRELDTKITRESSELINDLKAEGIKMVSDGSDILYIDLTTKFQAFLRLITSIGLLISIVLMVILSRFKGDVELNDSESFGAYKPIGIIAVVLLLACVISMIYSCNYIF